MVSRLLLCQPACSIHPPPLSPQGEGKTRVILPMLILHFADGRNLVRAGEPLSCCTSRVLLLLLTSVPLPVA